MLKGVINFKAWGLNLDGFRYRNHQKKLGVLTAGQAII
jgi:hypothetical protein